MNRPLGEKTEAAPAETAGFHEDYTLYLLAKASELASAEFHAELAAEGVSVGEWRVLAVLWTGEASVGALAEAGLMKQPTMTKLLDRMAAAGWVRRLGRGGDRRRVRLGLTEAGRAQAAVLIPKARAHEARLLGALPAGEAEALRAALRGLIARRMDGAGGEA
ncbi:MAG: MarR family winged helix-turn-helix transcriptional regulator [Pseudomonadota bacterium]